MGRTTRRRVTLALYMVLFTLDASLALGACTDVSGLAKGEDTVDAASDVAKEAAAEDVRVAEDAGADVSQSSDADASDGAPVNLLSNGNFELGCAGWSAANGATATEEKDAGRTGAGCRVCTSPAAGGALTQKRPMLLVAGQTFVGEVWMHDVPEPDASTGGVAAFIDIQSDGGSIMSSEANYTDPSSSMWTSNKTFVTVTGGDSLTFFVKVSGLSKCAIIDDALLYRQ